MTAQSLPSEKTHVSNPSLLLREAYSSSVFPPTLAHTLTAESKDTVKKGELLSLPFKLSITLAHSKLAHNVPYLRHSWSRIDLMAIVSFWIPFILATWGYERGHGRHIGIFWAMSVIRTARLLTVTTSMTTIMHSLKTARPLLTSVAYFVVFAMVLFSIIGMQSSFLAVYQIFSYENWTDVLYATGAAEISLGQSAIAAIFIAGWFLFANCKYQSSAWWHEANWG